MQSPCSARACETVSRMRVLPLFPATGSVMLRPSLSDKADVPHPICIHHETGNPVHLITGEVKGSVAKSEHVAEPGLQGILRGRLYA